MKQTLTIALLTIIITLSAFATSPVTSANINWTKAEKNYLAALNSDNVGLRYSATGFLSEYRLTGAVQPLIEVLKNDKVEQVRMAAAESLVKLGNKEGLDAVKDASVYDGSDKVAKYCEQLINTSLEELSLK